MPSLDANAVLRWLIADVPEQAARVEDLLSTGERFTIDDTALIETVFVLERVMRLDRPLIADALRTVASTAQLDLDRSLWEPIIKRYVSHAKLSIADLHLAARAARNDALPLYTFDRKLANQLAEAALL